MDFAVVLDPLGCFYSLLCFPYREGVGSEAAGARRRDRHRPGGAGDGKGRARHPEPVQALPEEEEVE